MCDKRDKKSLRRYECNFFGKNNGTHQFSEFKGEFIIELRTKIQIQLAIDPIYTNNTKIFQLIVEISFK